MLENIHRHMEEEGLDAFEAALKGSREIGFTIISISISLVAVFIPVLLMGGVIGRIFNEFAVVVTVVDRGLGLRVADADADAVLRKFCSGPSRTVTSAPAWSGILRARLRRPCCAATTAGSEAQPAPPARGCSSSSSPRWRGPSGCFSDRAEGLLPAGGHRAALGVDRGAPGRLLRRHGRRCSSRSQDVLTASRPTSRTSPRASDRRRHQRSTPADSSSS